MSLFALVDRTSTHQEIPIATQEETKVRQYASCENLILKYHRRKSCKKIYSHLLLFSTGGGGERQTQFHVKVQLQFRI